MAPRSTDISKQKRKKDRKNVLAGRRVSGLLWFFLRVWQNKTLPSRRPLWDGSPTSVTSVIISRCFTVRGEKQVKCHRPREGNHGWLLRWWPFSPRPNVKFVYFVIAKKETGCTYFISFQYVPQAVQFQRVLMRLHPMTRKSGVWCYLGLREPKRDRAIISSVCLSTIAFAVNHRLFLISVTGRARADPSSRLVRGRNIWHTTFFGTLTPGGNLDFPINLMLTILGLWEETRVYGERPV